MNTVRIAPRTRPALLISLALLCALLVGTFLFVRVLNTRLERLAELRFESTANQLAVGMSGKLDQYQDILYGAAGLFNASNAVVRNEWENFYRSQDPANRLNDLVALSIIRRVPDAGRAAFIGQVRNDTSRDPGGYPNFTITPEGMRPEYLVHDLVEPLESNPALFGYDAKSDPHQAAVLDLIAASGDISSTGFIDAAFDGTVIMVALPLYVGHRTPNNSQDRHSQLEGYVAATFSTDSFLRTVLKSFEGNLSGMAISLTDDVSSRSVALAGKPEDVPNGFDLQKQLVFGKRQLHLNLRAEKHFGLSDYETNLSLIAGIAGILVSFVVFGSLLYLSSSRTHAIELVAVATKELAVRRDELANQNEQLEEKVRSRTVRLNEKVAELEQSKAAMVNILEDLTIAKDEIEMAKAHDEALLTSIGDSVVAIDTSGRITMVNRAFEELFGRSAKDVSGKPLSDAVVVVREDGTPVPVQERTASIALNSGSHETVRSSDHYYQRADGSIFPIAVDASPIIEGDRVIGVVEIIRDITREKEIDRAKSEFVSLASHQLRTPLTTVGWYTELLVAPDTGPLNDTQSEYIKEVRNANRRMVGLVDALLNVSRIELGTFIIEPIPTDLVKMVKESVSDIASFVAKKNLHLNEWYEMPEMIVPLDQTLIRMITQNLLSNAVKYTPPNGTITISLNSKGGRIIMSVVDSGIGIARKDQPDIFKKMFRTDQARLVDPDGTGLGLYLTKSIVESSGGEISFTSEEKKGTSFVVSFPVSGMKARTGERRLQPAPITSVIHL